MEGSETTRYTTIEDSRSRQDRPKTETRKTLQRGGPPSVPRPQNGMGTRYALTQTIVARTAPYLRLSRKNGLEGMSR